MRFRHFIFSLFIFSQTFSYGQGFYDSPRHYAGMQILGPSLFTFHYEFHFFDNDLISIGAEAGFGRAEYSDDSQNPPTPGTHVIHTALNFNIGFPSLKFVGMVYPSTYFHGGLTFVNMNSFFGARYFFKGESILYLMAGYSPKLYTSLTTTEYIYTNFNICFRFGARF